MPLAELLPPIPAPPHDPSYVRLNALAAWWSAPPLDANIRVAETITLSEPPAAARQFDEPSGSLGGLTLPSNMTDQGTGLLLWDKSTRQLKRFDPCCCVFVPLPCVRVDASGLALCGDTLYIADPVVRRVRLLYLESFSLRDEWTAPVPWIPVGIAIDSHRHFYVADKLNASIHRFHGSGAWLGSFPVHGVPTRIVVDNQDRLIVVREALPGALVFDWNGTQVVSVSTPSELAAVLTPPFFLDQDGTFDLGPLCEGGGAHWFNASGDALHNHAFPSPSFNTSGQWTVGPFDSRIAGCAWHRVVLNCQAPSGTALQIATYTSDVQLPEDHLSLPELDWRQHPARLTNFACGEWDCLIPSPPGRYLWLRVQFTGNGTATPCIDEALIEYPRISLLRFLPAVFAEQPLAADFTHRFLAVFDTTLRSIECQVDKQARLYDPGSAPADIDPATGSDFLSWLAGWIGVSLDRTWPEARRRAWVRAAGRAFCQRGTPGGLRQDLIALLGMDSLRCEPYCYRPDTCLPPAACAPCATESPWEPPPLVLEHFQLRRWLWLGCGRIGECSELWGREIVNRSQLGENAQVGATKLVTSNDPYRDPVHVYAHRFSVFVPAWSQSAAMQRSLASVINAARPAHTEVQIEYVRPRFRIGIQASIGLNSAVGRYPNSVMLRETTLGRGSVLPPSPARAPRIGTTTTLN